MRTFISFCKSVCALLFFYALLYVSACSQTAFPFFRTHEKVVLKVPDSNAAYLSFIDEKGQADKTALSAGQGEICPVLPKNRVTPFLFYTGEADSCPLGCVYPYSTVSDKAGGFTAFILYRLFTCSQNGGQEIYERIQCFNWAKLKEAVSAYENPWILDDVLIAEKIAAGRFSARNIKKKKNNQ